ncbi:hypothetical protein F5Y16DRAFT_332438 [Xylariaceae sp. FL0255]|nr:hypothetical protein F5Y16DRAFT_332438 [Xylariaceae sp. FL0255]
MAPAQDHTAITAPSNEQQSQMQEIVLQPMTTSQPMDPERPHEDSKLGLRGGDRGGICPGRFCFCVPCPLPCDFCII